MNVERFEAFVQYNDMVGSVSADRGDQASVYQWLDERDLRQSKNELVGGIKLSIGENHGEELVNPVSVVFLLITGETTATLGDKIDSGQVPIQVRRIEIVMTIPEFFSLFKRFNITLSPNRNPRPTKASESKGILENVEYQYEEF